MVLSFITLISFAKGSNCILEKNAEFYAAQEYNSEAVKIEESSLLLPTYLCQDVTVIYADGSTSPGVLCLNMSDCNAHPADCDAPHILFID